MPLSVLVGITNTGATFPLAFVFISAESASMFRWVHEQLTSIIFYDCLLPKVVVGDFAKGLMAAFVEAKAEAEQENDDILAIAETEEDAELIELEQQKQTINRDIRQITLQLCEWHGAEAIKKRLINKGQYSQEKRKEIMNLV
jgi:hypothetical protein